MEKSHIKSMSNQWHIGIGHCAIENDLDFRATSATYITDLDP